MYAYSNGGRAFRAVDPEYQAGPGEALFPDDATPEQLAAAVPAYPAGVIADAQAAQGATLATAYAAAVAGPVSFTTAAKVTKTFQADPGSVQTLQQTLAGLSGAQATPAGFYWVAADNTQVPFVYADLQGLAAAMLAQGWTAFQHLQTLKAEVAAAATVAAVQAIAW